MKNIKYVLILSFYCFSTAIVAQIGLGTNTPDTSAILEMSSHEQGFILAKMDSAERDLLLNSAIGLAIYNTTTNTIEINIGSILVPFWMGVNGSVGPTGDPGVSVLQNVVTVIPLGLANTAVGVNAATLGWTTNGAKASDSTTLGGTTNAIAGVNGTGIGGTTNSADGVNAAAVGGTTNHAIALNANTVGGTTNNASGANGSVVGGITNNATGADSTVVGGTTNTASGADSNIIGGTTNSASAADTGIIGGSTNGVSGVNSAIIGGFRNKASGVNSGITGGNFNSATGVESVIIAGNHNAVTGAQSGVISGTTNTATGINSAVLGGTTNVAFGINSTVSGGSSNAANGVNSSVSGGLFTAAKSYGEWIGGHYGSDYIAQSPIAPISTDKIFDIANGTSGSNLSDAFAILKNGLAILPSVTNTLIGLANGKVVVTKEYVAANFSKIGTVAPAAATTQGTVGEIRITADFIYTCIVTNSWVRSSATTW